jgi:hypothetical protein
MGKHPEMKSVLLLMCIQSIPYYLLQMIEQPRMHTVNINILSSQ